MGDLVANPVEHERPTKAERVSQMRKSVLPILGLLAVLSVGCGGEKPTNSARAFIDLQPDSVNIAVGETFSGFTAYMNCEPQWSTTRTSIATVDSEGAVTGVSPGITLVVASCPSSPAKASSRVFVSKP